MMRALERCDVRRAIAIGVFLVGLSRPVLSQEASLPFPQNRVRDYYATQAAKYLTADKPIPSLLPDFPGLDGGTFGHWGQNPEADNFDELLNEVDYGGTVAQVVKHFGRTTHKAVCVQLGVSGLTALFDPEQLTFTDLWRGKLVTWQSRRYGITSGVSPAGPQVAGMNSSKWNMPASTSREYLGYYRNGNRIVFSYRIGAAKVYDHLWHAEGRAVRFISVVGQLPEDVYLTGALATRPDNGHAKAIADSTQPLWIGKTVQTIGELGVDSAAYAIDTLTIPYRHDNPFRSPMRMSGVDILRDGRLAVCNLCGDVWIVDGIDQSLEDLRWQRFAAGLHQPLGLVVQEDHILVLGRDQITRLHDRDDDGEADFYECVSNEYPTTGGNNFALTLHQDRNGTLYWFTRSNGFGVSRLRRGGKPESIATGLRGTNGTGVSADGSIVLATAQEGSWTPASAIFEVGDGSYHGFFGPKEEYGKYGYELPLCFIPRGIDNSSGDICFLTNDPRLGPLAGRIIGTSFGYCQHYMIIREAIGDSVQGGIVPLPGEFLSGAHRLRPSTVDGHLYVAGTDGWQSYAQENGSLQRLRYTGKPMHLPTSIDTHENGLLIRFNCELDPKSVRKDNVFCEQWNYLYSQAYGSPELSIAQPTRRGHDYVATSSIKLLADRRSVFIEIPHLHPVMQFHLYMRLQTASGNTITPDVYYSIFKQRPAFTEFADYSPVARKRRYPSFPIAEKYPQDPRLLAQESLGKTVGEVIAREINAIPGLQYEPRQIRVPPGRRVGITFRNTDPSMPHNFVVVQKDRLQAIGEAAMLLATDPRAIATHYVPDDPGVICLSPILNPDDQYTVYFDSPEEQGAYPFVCTFPGHWKVMQGVLHVVDENAQLPQLSEPSPSRNFVKMWRLADLAADADRPHNASFERGREMFSVAGCIKCHAMGDSGTHLGPDLTDVHQRFRGAKLLQQILEPSSEIHKEYQAYVVSMSDGTVTTGLKVKEGPNEIHLLPNPLEPKQVVVIRKDEAEEISASKQSTMPKGLLMTLTRQEILDLLHYVERGGGSSGSKSENAPVPANGS